MDFNNLTIFFVVRESVQRAWKLFDKEPADEEGGGEDDGHAQHPPNPWQVHHNLNEEMY